MPQYNDTKYGSLEETLNAIGKAAFVRFYYDFKDATIPTDILAEKYSEKVLVRDQHDRGSEFPEPDTYLRLDKN